MVKRVSIGFIVGAIILGLFAFDLHATDINSLKNKQQDVSSQQSDYQMKDKELGKQIQEKAKEVDDLQSDVDTTQAKVDKLDNSIRIKKEEMANRKDGLEKRLRNMYKKGTVSFVDIILSSNNVTEFISNLEFVQKIYENDKNTLRTLTSEHEQLKKDEKKVVEYRASLEEKQRKVAEAKKSLEKDQAQVRKQIEELKQAYADLGNQIYSAQQAEMAKQQGSQNGSSNNGTTSPGASGGSSYVQPGSTGIFQWPVRGMITSEFGYRSFILNGAPYTDFHTGLDIAAPAGTPICAADGGKVIIAGNMPVSGNTVVIDHGNGLSTLYGHNSSIAVSVGQTVSKGQVIAYCGMTGFATGNHCHFQVNVNGRAVNPRGYL